MSVATTLQQLATDLQNAYTAVSNKGGTVPTNKNSNNLATAISSIPPQTSVEEKDINFYDYNGARVYSYTKAEFALLTALPDMPTHSGLTSVGWNWTLAQAQTFLTNNDKLNIGATYSVTDGKTRIWFNLTNEWRTPYVGMYLNGEVDIDWGDGSAHSTLTGTSLSTLVETSHTYATGGDYLITIEVTSGSASVTGSYYTSQLFYGGNSALGTTAQAPYLYRVKEIWIGSDFTFSTNAFKYMTGLTGIVYPRVNGDLTTSVFNGCSSLVVISNSNSGYMGINCATDTKLAIMQGDSTSSILGSGCFSGCKASSLPMTENIATIRNQAYMSCINLLKINIPAGVTEIQAQAFSGCFSLKEIHFRGTTPPTIAAATVFTNLPTGCTIYVPQGYLNTYTGTNNMPDPTVYTYVEE